MKHSYPPSTQSARDLVRRGVPDRFRTGMMGVALILASGCNSASNVDSVTSGSSPAKRLTVRTNDLLNGPAPTLERFVGDWELRHGTSVMKVRWLPKGTVEAPASDAPDGMLHFSFDGFDQGSGMTTLEVVFNSSEKRLDIYELGTVKSDGKHPPQPLGSAMLIGDNLIQVRCMFDDLGNRWDIDCICVREHE